MRKVVFILALLLPFLTGYTQSKGKTYTSMAQALVNPSAVTSLSLKGQSLKVLSADIEKLTNLQILDLSYNAFTAVPPQVFKLKKLKTLYINNNALTALPIDMSGFASLTSLRLDYNPFANPLAELKKTSTILTLSELNFSANKVNAFPVELLKLSHLSDLDLGYGSIKELPKDIDKLTNLKRLVLTKNAITTFPASFFKLSKLQNLDLSYNGFTKLQEDFVNLPLDVLDISYNKTLTYIPAMKGLRYVNIKSTKLDADKLKWALGESSIIMM